MSKKVYTGKVVSDKMDKTAVVAVTRLFQQHRCKKTVKRVTKFKAHDESNRCSIGDTVKIIEASPLSKNKRWIVIDILDKVARGD